jgi:glycosyltransferase involved in cell wall biosynthesis
VPARSAYQQENRRRLSAGEQAPGQYLRNPVIFAALCQFLFFRPRPVTTPDILVVTRADLFPVDHGAAVKIIRTAESLSRLGQDVCLCTDNRQVYYRFHQGSMETLRYPLWLRFLALPRPLALLRLLWRRFPLSNAFLYFALTDASYTFRSLWLAGQYPIGACLAEFPAYVLPCSRVRSMYGCRVVLVEHNVEYDRLRTQVRGLSEAAYATLRYTELQMCSLADAVITVSDNDRDRLLREGVPPAKVQTIPHGVDLAGLQGPASPDVRSRYGIAASDLLLVYHGTYSYGPNLEAVRLLASELLPRLERAGLAVSVLAIGNRPPAETMHPRIHFTGSVGALGAVLPAADMAVIPLQDGGGTRMKILDYFAAGVPVVSTTKGIEGIPVTHGIEALIIDDFDAMAAAVVSLAGNAGQRGALVEAASTFVHALSWDSIAERYLPLLGIVATDNGCGTRSG